MRILHTSDWHLGRTDGEKSLLNDQEFFLDRIYEIAESQNIDAIIIAGDVYDRAIASAEAIRLFDEAMNRLCLQMGKQVLCIAGNHDSADRLASCSELLKKAGLHVAGRLTRPVQRADFDEVNVYLLPWFNEEKVKELYPEKRELVDSLEAAYGVVLDEIRANMDGTKRNILVSHAFVTNAETSKSDKAACLAFADNVGASVFGGFDYVALGHIHKPQSISETVRYSGTPMPYSFGKEESQVKSVTIIDTENMEQTTVPLKLLHERRTLVGGFDELCSGRYLKDCDKFENDGKSEEASESTDYSEYSEYTDCSDELKNGYLRLQVIDKYVGLEGRVMLEQFYPNFMEIIGKSYSDENGTIRMSLEEFRELESDPIEIFKSYCREVLQCEPSEHQLEQFEAAMAEAEEEVL